MSLTQIFKEEISNITTVYHGTNNPERSFNNSGIFVSKNKNHAEGYGNKLYKLKIDTSNIIDTTDMDDLKKIFNKVGSLYDPYDGTEYNTAKEFYNNTIDNTWEPIEKTDRSIHSLKRMADAVLITEGGYINYFIFNMDIIKAKQQIK